MKEVRENNILGFVLIFGGLGKWGIIQVMEGIANAKAMSLELLHYVLETFPVWLGKEVGNRVVGDEIREIRVGGWKPGHLGLGKDFGFYLK